MKDLVHHLKHLTKKVVRDARKSETVLPVNGQEQNVPAVKMSKESTELRNPKTSKR